MPLHFLIRVGCPITFFWSKKSQKNFSNKVWILKMWVLFHFSSISFLSSIETLKVNTEIQNKNNLWPALSFIFLFLFNFSLYTSLSTLIIIRIFISIFFFPFHSHLFYYILFCYFFIFLIHVFHNLLLFFSRDKN